MLTIYKLRSESAIDYAAEEMKKYLRMMMPDAGDVKILYNPEATDGFRLGLYEDFGMTITGADAERDDELYIQTDTQGGILAGSNPRSVLFCVYRFFRENGCRWLYPGVGGDYVPMQDIVPVSYHKLADHRIRGFCDEGAEYQESMLEAIEYYAKLELNTFCLEFFIPYCYYGRYYEHSLNSNRIPEKVTEQQVLQWRRECEVELNKRGMVIPSIGHGWIMRALDFHVESFISRDDKSDDSQFTEEQREVLAMINGKRGLYDNFLEFTQVCMSRADVRTKIADSVVEYAQSHPNLTYLFVILADGGRNHCECENCKKLRPSDWYCMILNEIDEKLTAKNLPTKIAFACYMDTFFPPKEVWLKNPDRFIMNYCPITRKYSSSITADTELPEAPEFVYNDWKYPTTEEAYALLKQWQKGYCGDIYCFEYHFYKPIYEDVSTQALARRVYEDIRSLKTMGICGIVEDGTQRCAFPNGFPVYIYAETLMNRDCDFDAVREDYFCHAYGEDWEVVMKMLDKVNELFDFDFVQGLASEDPSISKFYAPSRVPKLAVVHDLAAQMRFQFARHKQMPVRVQSISWQLLNRYSEYCEFWADIMAKKAQGYVFEPREMFEHFIETFGKYELEIQRYYDHYLASYILKNICNANKGVVFR